MPRKPAKELGRPADTDSEQTRANILSAAKECFGTSGFKSTSNRDIAEKAGVTAATIYYYFKNKSDLFVSAHLEVQEKTLSIASRCANEASSLTEGWIQMTQEIAEMQEEDPSIAKFNAVVRLEAMRNPEISEALHDKEWRKIFHTLADIGKKTGELAPDRDREFRAVMSAINFGLVQHSIESTPEAHEECIRGFIDLFNGDLIKPKKLRRKKAKLRR